MKWLHKRDSIKNFLKEKENSSFLGYVSVKSQFLVFSKINNKKKTKKKMWFFKN